MENTRPLVEICCPSREAAFAAIEAGADRLELCTNLEVGGTTPSREDIIEVVGAASSRGIPVNVLIRPREGDFVYSPEELKAMKEDIVWCGRNGVFGVVVGVLDQRGDIDLPSTRELLNLARVHRLSFTFHRAIDETWDYMESVKALLRLHPDRILSSGGAPTAWEGKRNLCMATYIASKVKTIVMPGSGVTPENVAPLLDFTLAREVHGSRISLIQAVSDYYNGRYVL